MEQSIPLLDEFGGSESVPADFNIEKRTGMENSRCRIVLSSLKHVLPRFMQFNGLKFDHENLHSTAWLDSLRGYAACSVFFTHVSLPR